MNTSICEKHKQPACSECQMNGTWTFPSSSPSINLAGFCNKCNLSINPIPHCTCDEYISQVRSKALQEVVEKIKEKKVINNGKPDTDLTYQHYDFGYRVGFNQALDEVISIINQSISVKDSIKD